jgi:hypothetical protein
MDMLVNRFGRSLPLGIWWTNIVLFSVVAWASLFQSLF